MMNQQILASRLLAVVLAIALHFSGPFAIAGEPKGHSRHGSAFDTGLRQRPWRMDGIGQAPFPITTSVPEAQEWFNQGNALLHSFWWEEAERSFRWALKLDSECAMAYWGLARCGMHWLSGLGDHGTIQRNRDFLKEAVRRKHTVSERERLYIEAWELAMEAEAGERVSVLNKRLHELVLKYPDDVEAKSLLALFSIGSGNQLGTEMIVRDILARHPEHPGAHHIRIHSWDGQFAHEAISSCQPYMQIAPGIGHALHMPGHIYSKVGMWHEAARAMDAATRVELRYMNDRLALPFETWNFAHNRDFLSYIQEQLGMAEASLHGTLDLQAGPLDPDRKGHYVGETNAQLRALVKFERWHQILKADTIKWRNDDVDKHQRAYVETLAYVGLNKTVDARARLGELKQLIKSQGNGIDEELAAMMSSVAEGLLFAAERDLLEATRLLTSAAAIEQEQREQGRYPSDPPEAAWPIMRLLGDVYLRAGEHRLAIDSYERSLKLERNDAFALAGLAQAHDKLGNREKAAEYAGRFAVVWSNCDPGLRWKVEVDALGLNAAPVAQTPVPERPYSLDTNAHLGSLDWEPFAAPKLECLNADGKPVRLEDFRGKNVLLVFYLGEDCVHCMEQLVEISKRAEDWTTQNTVVLAVSSATPEKNKASEKLGGLSMQLLSDRDHSNARRFTSYDDFEELELHSTILIDTKGRVHWKRTGGDPFTKMDFLVQALKRMNKEVDKPQDARAKDGEVVAD